MAPRLICAFVVKATYERKIGPKYAMQQSTQMRYTKGGKYEKKKKNDGSETYFRWNLSVLMDVTNIKFGQ